MTSLIKVEEFGASVMASDDLHTRVTRAGEVGLRIRDFLVSAEEGATVFVTLVKPDLATAVTGEICGGETW